MRLNFFNKLSKEDKIFYLSLPLIIFLFIASEYLLFRKGFYAISADESLHTLEAYKFFTGQSGLFSVWLPFQKVVYAAAFKFHYDLFLTPRVISGLFGLFTLLSLIEMSFQLFGNRIVSLMTGFFGAIFLPIYLFSVLPLEEIYFFFFTIFSVTFYLKWLNNDRSIYLWLSVAASCIGTTTRYESWLFSAALFVMITFRIIAQNKPKKTKVLFVLVMGLILSIFPLYWIYLSQIHTGKITGFVTSVANLYKSPPLLTQIKNNVMFGFFKINLESLNIIGVIPLFFLIKKNINVKYSALIFGSTLLFFSAATFIIKAMPTHNHWRLAMVWSLFLLPFTCYLLYFLLTRGLSSYKYLAGFIFSFFLLIFLFTIQDIRYGTRSYITTGDITVGRVMENILNKNNSKVYINSGRTWNYSTILIISQKPDRFVTGSRENFNPGNSTLTLDDNSLSQFKKLNIDYLVLKPYIKIAGEGKVPFTVIRFAFWNVYKLSY